MKYIKGPGIILKIELSTPKRKTVASIWDGKVKLMSFNLYKNDGKRCVDLGPVYYVNKLRVSSLLTIKGIDKNNCIFEV